MSEFSADEAARRKKAVFDSMSERRQKHILKRGYDRWDPFEEPKDPIDIRKDKTKRTTQMLVRERGYNMPRDADQQAAWSGVVSVERKDLQPGDLLFFGSSPKKIDHTGMYIGDGQFIHDVTSGHPVVQISKLDDEPWTRLLVASRRLK